MGVVPGFTERFDKALMFAAALHRTQTRKGSSVPYVGHLLAVAALVIDDGGSEDEAIGALLHDSLEDGSEYFDGGRQALRQNIAERFGEEVLAIVEACTDDEGHQKGVGGSAEGERRAWLARKEAYAATIARKSLGALRVTAADKVHNAESMIDNHGQCGAELWMRFRTNSKEDQILVYRRVSQAISERSVELTKAGVPCSALPGRLARAVRLLEALV
jgi:(p)ppGpp synthase/HD superfamily hydrolase